MKELLYSILYNEYFVLIISIIILVIILKILMKNKYRPYFEIKDITFTVLKDKINNIYIYCNKFEDIDDGINHEIENADVIYRNGIIEVSTDDFVGTLNNNLTISEDISVEAINSDANNTASENFRDVRRGLSNIEVISQVNKILYKGLHDANDDFDNNDWWGGEGWLGSLSGNAQTYYDDNITVVNSSGSEGIPARPSSDGHITLTGYSISTALGVLRTASTVYIGVESGGDAGFLDSDNLLSLKSGSISLDLSSADSHYKTYTVRYSNVYVDHSEGNYYVTVDGRESEAISATNVEQRPY